MIEAVISMRPIYNVKTVLLLIAVIISLSLIMGCADNKLKLQFGSNDSSSGTGRQAGASWQEPGSSLPAGKFIFLEHIITMKDLIPGKPGNIAFSSTGSGNAYEYDPASKTLAIPYAVTPSYGLKAIYGEQADRYNVVAPGKISNTRTNYLNYVNSLPYTGNNIRILDIESDGTVIIDKNGEQKALKVGEEWEVESSYSDNIIYDNDFVEVTHYTSERIINHGFLDNSCIVKKEVRAIPTLTPIFYSMPDRDWTAIF